MVEHPFGSDFSRRILVKGYDPKSGKATGAHLVRLQEVCQEALKMQGSPKQFEVVHEISFLFKLYFLSSILEKG